MGSYRTLNDFVLDCRETTRVSHLWHKSLDFLQDRKITRVSYHSDDAQLPGSKSLGIVAEGFPDIWVCEYLNRELRLIDPIPQLAAMTSRPFLWSETPKLMVLSEEASTYMEILARADLGDGLAMQVYGPHMRNAYVGLGFGRGEVGITADEIFELQCAAQIAHIRYCELTEDRQKATDGLSPREVEILQWVARGKSNSVIADILGVSRHTVDTLIRRIFNKLEVNDRTTAAIRGIGSGLVHTRRGAIV